MAGRHAAATLPVRTAPGGRASGPGEEQNRVMQATSSVAVDGLALSHDTVPSSCLWDLSESGLTISNISEPGPVISFRTGPVKSTKVARGEAVPAAMIRG